MKQWLGLAPVAAALFSIAPAVKAATSAWTGVSDSEWTNSGNWDNGVPNGAGEVANFAILANVTIASDITVGQITDVGAAPDSQYLASLSGPGKLIWDNNGSGALFEQENHFYSGSASAWSVDMQLNDNLLMDLSTQRHRTLESTISGTGHLTLDINGNNGVLFTIGGSSANTYSGGTTVNNNKQYSWNTVPLVLLSKDGAMGTGDVTLVAVSAYAASTVTITSSGGTEDRIDDSAMLTLNHDTTGGYTVVTLDTDVEETVGGLTLDGTVMAAGTYNATTHSDWFAGNGDLIVIPEPATMSLLAIGGIALLRRKRR